MSDKNEPKKGKGSLAAAAGTAVLAAAFAGCAGAPVQPNVSARTQGGETVRINSGGVAATTRGSGGTHGNVSVGTRKTCVGGGGNVSTNVGVCLDTGAVMQGIRNILGGGAQQPAGVPTGQTPSPFPAGAPGAVVPQVQPAGTTAPAAPSGTGNAGRVNFGGPKP